MTHQENQYSIEQAAEEAQRMFELIADGTAVDYPSAEKHLERRKKYDPRSEYHVNLESPEIQKEIAEAVQLYHEFYERYVKEFDLNNEAGIDRVYVAATKAGVFEKAQKVRELLFGKDIHFYGVSYLWDQCNENCAFCGFGKDNRAKAKAEGRPIPERKMTPEDAVQDTEHVLDDGHTHVCYLTGSAPGPKRYPDKIIPYLEKIIADTKDRDLQEIILNIPPLYEEGFAAIVAAVHRANEQAGTNVALQFRVFQETYNRQAYQEVIGPKPGHPMIAGSKQDFDFRTQSQERALQAGFNEVGIGVLFGLHEFPLEEVESLRQHFEHIKQKFGKSPARVCLPSANELQNMKVNIPHFLQRGQYTDPERKKLLTFGPYEKFNELVYALTRLALPTANIVSSERDPESVLEFLDKYATCCTLDVQPGVGENAKIYSEEENHGEQATTFPRRPKETVERMRARGYNPIINLPE